MRTKQLLSMNG